MNAARDAAGIRRDPVQWDAFVAAATGGSFPQLTAWARANAVKGWRVSRVVLESGDGVIGAQILVHRMRPSPWSRGYAARGPIAEGLDETTIRDFTASVRVAAPPSPLAPRHRSGDHDRPCSGVVAQAGGLAAHRSDLDQPDACRRPDPDRSGALVRPAVQRALVRQQGTPLPLRDRGCQRGRTGRLRADLPGDRTPVGLEPGAAFRAVYREFAADAAARLLLARAPGGETVATLVLLTCGQRITEFYGASTRDGARGRANYLLKWEAIRSSRERGFASYDMWGTDQHGLAEFKAGFGGEERQYIGAWELVTDRPGRWVVDAVARGRALGGAVRRRRADPSSTTDDHPGAVAWVRVARVSASAPDGWDELTVAAPGGHVMQGTAWAEHRRSQGGEPRFVEFDDGRGALVILRRSPGLPGATASVGVDPRTLEMGRSAWRHAAPRSLSTCGARGYATCSSTRSWTPTLPTMPPWTGSPSRSPTRCNHPSTSCA
ncbi:MAG: peptidoglycan bridge formation glycyltransferase FemA/FemB family protein [Chloroflexi bacterium]|nr:peptidoglycan bridge formation glycyltransferase FemA/FemB family protein [Chloroflexota bacterium]